MDIIIREYRPEDYVFLVQCMNGMQQHIASIDVLQRSKSGADFSGEKWVDNLLKKIEQQKGMVFIAEYDGKQIGCIAGVIKEPTEQDAIDLLPFKDGRIMELFVDPSYRGKKVGSILVEKMEAYFRDNGCQVVELGCMLSNVKAHHLYKKHGYMDLYVDMGKKL